MRLLFPLHFLHPKTLALVYLLSGFGLRLVYYRYESSIGTRSCRSSTAIEIISYRYESRTGTRSLRSSTATGMNSYRYDSYWDEISYQCHVNKNSWAGLNSYRYENRTGMKIVPV